MGSHHFNCVTSLNNIMLDEKLIYNLSSKYSANAGK